MNNYNLRAEDTVGAPEMVGILDMVAAVNEDRGEVGMDEIWPRYPKIPLPHKRKLIDTYACY